MVFAQVVPSPWEGKREITREYQEAARRAGPDAELSYGGLEGFMTAKALAVSLRAAGRSLSRGGFVKTLESSSFDLGGVSMRFAPGDHEGSRFVDLSMVSREGRFIHRIPSQGHWRGGRQGPHAGSKMASAALPEAP